MRAGASIFDLFAGHEIGRELKAMSAWLHDHREPADLVAADLRQEGVKATGRQGFAGGGGAALRRAQAMPPAELPGARVHFEDSASFRAFARLPHGWSPQKSVLHQTISAIRAETSGQINRTPLASAREIKLEHGRVVRLDSTLTAALIHEPSDSSRLWDAVRVMVRLLREAEAWGDRPLIERIIAQSERRVLAGEAVPASDKLVSLFEPHADIIRKGREIAYGHKLSPDHRPQRSDSRFGHRSGQSGRQ
jgi:IS5 family transposase